jgi:uncharacterized protein
VSRTTFVDTQFVVALVNRRDQDHQRAVELSHAYTNQSLLTTELVLVEIGDALAGEFRREAVQLIEYFRQAANVEIAALTPALFAEAFALYCSRHDKAWGMTNCVSFVVMRQQKVQDALTFDQHFEQAGFSALLRRKV